MTIETNTTSSGAITTISTRLIGLSLPPETDASSRWARSRINTRTVAPLMAVAMSALSADSDVMVVAT